MHLQLSPAMWGELEDAGQLGKDRHWHLENDGWLEECLGHPGSDVSAEYHLKTHWKILLVGARGAGMFNHSDSLQTSSWHATVAGRARRAVFFATPARRAPRLSGAPRRATTPPRPCRPPGPRAVRFS